MTSLGHDPAARWDEPRRWSVSFGPSEVWASLAITVMWLAVLFDAVFGPDIVNTSAGGDRSAVPSAIPVAVFAWLATWAVARHGFRHDRKS